MKYSQDYLDLFLRTAPVAVIAIDSTGRILYVNEKLEQLFLYDPGELLGQPLEILLPLQLRQQHITHRLSYLAAPRARPMGQNMDLIGKRKDDSEFPIEIGLNYLIANGEILAMGSVVDITARKQVEQLLEQRVLDRTQELDRQRLAAEGIRNILAMINTGRPLQAILDSIAGQISALLGAKACAICHLLDENGGMDIPFHWGFPADFIEHYAHHIAEQPDALYNQLIQEQRTIAIPTLDPNRNNDSEAVLYMTEESRQFLTSYGIFALLAIPLLVQNRLYGSLTIYFAAPHLFSPEDMLVAQTLAEQTALAIDNARYYLEVRRKAVASERTRLAHDLHDSVTQTLFSASIIADILPRLWEVRPEEGRRRLQDLRELARGALAEMRSLLLELRPETMKTVILPELLQQLTTAFIGRSRLPVHLVLPEECDMPETVRMAFYRITQEALNNVTKHADATRVSLVLNCLPRRVELLIGDDGRGFDPTHVTGNHLGLNIMSERAKGIGATLRVDSTPGKGTEVRVLWRRV